MMLNARALRRLTALLAATAAAGSFGQAKSVEIPAGTPLAVKLSRHVPMKVGTPLECRLMYPVYAENQLTIPAGSVVRGSVVTLNSDRRQRIHSRLKGDFTPFHVPVVHFDQLVLPDGETERISSGDAADGAQVLRISPPDSEESKSFFVQQMEQMKEFAKATAAQVTAPGRTDRLVQFIYKQLPYHPERIEAATTWTVTLAQPLRVKAEEQPVLKNGESAGAQSSSIPAQTAPDEKPAWHIRAYLQQTISSATEKPGNSFEAVVAEPIFNPDHTMAVPEGSVLVGTITRAKAARSFGRAGKLRFDFRMLKLPGAAPPEHISGTLAGAHADASQRLVMDREGGVEQESKNRVILPLLLTLLASRALDDDGNATVNAAIGSNGFGIVGRIIGMAGGSRGLAAGIGFYGAGVAFSERWLVHGQEVSFAKNTRIEVTTMPRRNSSAAVESGHSGAQ